MDRRVTPPKRVTSPTWGPPPPYKQAVKGLYHALYYLFQNIKGIFESIEFRNLWSSFKAAGFKVHFLCVKSLKL